LNLKATSVGELVKVLASKGANGRVKRTFRNSAYLEAGRGLLLLLRAGLKSPMTVNLNGGPDFSSTVSPNQSFAIDSGRIDVGSIVVQIKDAPVFRSALLKRGAVAPLSEMAIVKNATAIKLLYSASTPALELVNARAFTEFAKSVLEPMTAGDVNGAYLLRNYVGLIGSGTGFTPAGDDVVGGFVSAFNYYARGTGKRLVELPLPELRKRTVHESAHLLNYAQHGYVDEAMERLILAGLGNRQQEFRARLSDMASRGHTSGLDMSVGVLMLVAAVSDSLREGNALKKSLAALAK